MYLITANELQLIGAFPDVLTSKDLKEPSFIFLAADCYEVFICPAQSEYSPAEFLTVAENSFNAYFPHLEAIEYQLILDQPQFDRPFLCLAVKKYWLEQCTNQLTQKKFYSAQVQPLATYIFKKTAKDQARFICTEPEVITHFVQTNGELDMVFRQHMIADETIDFKTWMSLK